MDPLLTELLDRVRSGRSTTSMADWQPPGQFPPATRTAIAAAEARLGFTLPDLLREIYATVGNGGFGPGYGLIGVEGGHTDWLGARVFGLAELYERFRTESRTPPWPDRWLPVCHWGCAIYSCLDCSSPDAPVLAFDPNRKGHGPWRSDCKVHVGSFAEWMRMWLRGEDLWESMPLDGPPRFGFEPD